MMTPIEQKAVALRGANFHRRNSKGELVAYVITAVEIGRSVNGTQWIDRVCTQRAWLDDKGYIRYSPPRWVLWTRAIDTAVIEYRRVHGAGI